MRVLQPFPPIFYSRASGPSSPFSEVRGAPILRTPTFNSPTPSPPPLHREFPSFAHPSSFLCFLTRYFCRFTRPPIALVPSLPRCIRAPLFSLFFFLRPALSLNSLVARNSPPRLTSRVCFFPRRVSETPKVLYAPCRLLYCFSRIPSCHCSTGL